MVIHREMLVRLRLFIVLKKFTFIVVIAIVLVVMSLARRRKT